ncbi:MAG: SRPBCC family protein [Actinomycetota bacterium]|nr:SRPBCC family protein [Actinomycetota bacterium]
MAWFKTSTRSEAVVAADRTDVWAALVDPDLLPRLTPFLRHIEVLPSTLRRGSGQASSGQAAHWRWELTRIPILGASLQPTFTEKMRFEEGCRIEFEHDPPAGVRERAGVEGWYHLADVEGGTHLAISLGVAADLPIGRIGKPAVVAAMKGVLAGMGSRFSANLLDHLGVAH